MEKVETDYNLKPSKVLHIRNIPNKLDPVFIVFLAVPFGFVESIIKVKMDQALIQMQEIGDAIKMVNYYNKYIPLFYNKQIFIQFSKHQKLDWGHNHLLIQNGNDKREYYITNLYYNELVDIAILDVVLDNTPSFSIDHLVFYKIFSRFGKILRLVINKQNDQYRCLVEFSDPLSAHVAQVQLDGSSIFGENDLMTIEFSKDASPLQLIKSSFKSRDYLQNPLNVCEIDELNDQNFDFPIFSSHDSSRVNHGSNDYVDVTDGCSEDRMDISNSFEEATVQLTTIARQLGIEFSPAVALAAASLLVACNKESNQNFSSTFNGGRTNSNDSTSSIDEYSSNNNNVVIVTHLNPEKSNPDSLFKLFGMYGRVLQIKMTLRNKSIASVKYTTHQQAVWAVENLDKLPLWESQIRVSFSENNVVNCITTNYGDSMCHRYISDEMYCSQNIYAPNTKIHVSRMPPTTTKEQLHALFKSHGYETIAIRFLPKPSKMAVVTLLSLADAVNGLLEFHDYLWIDNYRLRVSFST